MTRRSLHILLIALAPVVATACGEASLRVDAGPDQHVTEGTQVTLAVDVENAHRLEFSWTQISGPPVMLEGASSPVATFVAPQVEVGTTETVALQVTARRRAGASNTDTVRVEVESNDYVAFRASSANGEPVELYAYNAETGQTRKLNPPLLPGRNVFWFEWAPGRSRVLFSADAAHEDVVELYSVRPDGTGLVKLNRPVRTLNEFATSGDLSPDGSRLLVYHSRDGNRTLFAVGVDGTHRVELSEALGPLHDVVRARWAVESDRVVFAGRALNDKVHIYSVELDGSNLTQLSHLGRREYISPYYGWTVSSSGARVVYTVRTALHDAHVFSVRLNGDARVQLDATITGAHLSTVEAEDFSPNGAYLSLHDHGSSTTPGNGVRLYLVRLDGRETAFLHPQAVDAAPVWSPDGTRLSYLVQTIEGRSSLQIVDAHGVPRAEIPFLIGKRVWSSSGEQLIVDGQLLEGASWTLYRVQSDGTDLEQLSYGSGYFGGVFSDWEVSSDESEVTYRHATDDGPQLYITNISTAERSRLSVPLNGAKGVPDYEWSPTGTHIGYTVDLNDAYRRDLYTVRRDGSGTTLLNDGAEVEQWGWSPDGTRITFRTQLGATGPATAYVVRVDGTDLIDLGSFDRIEDVYWAP